MRLKKTIACFLAVLLASSYVPYSFIVSLGLETRAFAQAAAPVHSFGKETGNIRIVELDATPAGLSGIAGISPADAAVEGAADLPVKIRFGASGKLEAADGQAWRSDAGFSYEAGQTYHLKWIINLPLQTYDVWATAPSGQPVLIGADLRMDGELSDIGKAYSLAEEGAAPSVTNARVIPNAFTSKKDLAPNNTTFDIESDNSLQGRSYSVHFDIRLTGDPTVTDALVALSDSKISIPAAGFGNLSYILQINGNKFNVRDDAAYRQDTVVEPESGVDYHVSFEFEPDGNGQAARTYDVWLAKAGEAPVRIADNYKMRNFANAAQFPSDNLNKIIVYSASDGLLLAKNLVVLDGERLKQTVSAINAAPDAAVREALESNALGLALDKYALMKEESKLQVAQDVLEARPQEGGYENALAVQAVFENSVANRRDTQPPTAPGNLKADITKSLQAVITWEPSQDDTEILYYKVYRDGVEIKHVTSGTAMVDTDIRPDTSYTYTVKAFDLVLKEAESAPVTVRTPAAAELTYFPLTYSAVSTAFGQGLLGYVLEPIPASQNPSGQQYVMEWRAENEGPAYAMQLLTIAAMHDPDYLGPDGVTTATQRALEQFRSVLTPGKEPGLSGSGLSGQGYMPVLQSFLLAKQKVPSIWNQLTPEEKNKIDLMMLAGFFAAKFTYDTENDYKTPLDNSGNFDKNWNPNHRAGLIAAILAYYYFDGNTAWLNDQARNFNFDEWIQQLGDAGLPNVKLVHSNLGKTMVEQGIRKDNNNDGFTYTYDVGAGNITVPLSQPGRLAKALTEITFRHPVAPVGAVENGERKGYLMDGYAEYPNLGASSMGYEYITMDANGVRSSNNYVFMGWKPNIEAVLPIMLFGRPETDISEQELRDVLIRLDVGTTDLIYKNTNGYMSYSKGKNEGATKVDPIQLAIISDVYYSVVNNPLPPLANANAAQSPEAMRTVLESADLALVLWGYNALPEESKAKAAQHVLAVRPEIGFKDKKAVQDALYEAVKIQALDAVNRAANEAEMSTALKSRALGLYIPEYDSATTALKQQTLAYLLENRPAGGYPGKQLLLDMVKEGVLPQGNQLKNLPKVPEGETRFNLEDYDKWPEQYGEAKVALWKDDKVGAFTFSIDDNHFGEVDQWLEIVNPYNFKLTWFLIGSKILDNQISKYAQLIAAGHDLAAHSYYHGYDAGRDGNLTKDEYTLREFEWTNARINSIPGANLKSFAGPGGINFPSGKGFNYALVADYYSVSRGGEGLPSHANSVNYLDVNALSHPASSEIYHVPGKNSVESMVKSIIDPAYTVWNQRYYRGWTNMFSHHITELGKENSKGERFTTKQMATEMFRMLNENRDKIWVDTFTNVGLYAQQRDTARVLTLVNAADKIELSLTDRMADDIFDQPLTLKVKVSENWEQVSALQNGEAIPARLVAHEGQTYVYVNAVPDRGRVTLVPYGITPLMIVNGADTAERILAAIAEPELGLELGEFNGLDARRKLMVGKRLLEVRPADGFANSEELQSALDAAVEEAKNAPPLSANAKLSALKVNGVTIPGFSPEIYEYDVTLPEGTTALPDISFQAADTGKATAVLENAQALPGTAKVTVTAEDEMTVAEYIIRFQVRIPALQWINTAASGAVMRTAIENSALGLVLGVYNSLTDAQKNTVAAAVLANRPAGGYADAYAVQAALNAAIPQLKPARLAHAIVNEAAKDTVNNSNWVNLFGGTGSTRKAGVYLKFDLASLAGLDAAAIAEAKVQIYAKTPSHKAIAYAAPNEWTVPLTWNTQPLEELKNSNLSALQVIGEIPTGAQAGNYYLNVTDYLKGALTEGKTELSLVILGSTNALLTLEQVPSAFAMTVSLASTGEPNPAPSPLQAVNAASSAEAMQAAIAVPGLDLNLTEYNALTAEQQAAVAQMLLDRRPAGGYANALAVQNELNAAVGALPPPVGAVTGTLAASAAELQPGQPLELTVGVGAASRFTAADVTVHYDPDVLEFATDQVDGVQMLRDDAIQSLHEGYQVSAAVYGQPGKLRALLFTAGPDRSLAGTEPLFKLRAAVKESAELGVTAAVYLSGFELTFEGEEAVVPETAAARVSLLITAQPQEADKTALHAAITYAQTVLDGAVVGPYPGQYPQSAYDALAGAIGLAQTVRDQAGATQSAVDQARAALQTAVQQFFNAVNPASPGQSADFTALNAAIAKGQKQQDEGPYGDKIGTYPESAKTALKMALDAAKAVRGSSSASQEAVNAAVTALNGAIQTFEQSLITLVGGGATKVGIRDLSLVAKYYGITHTHPDWSKVAAADIKDGNEITIEVLAAVARMILTDWAAGE